MCHIFSTEVVFTKAAILIFHLKRYDWATTGILKLAAKKKKIQSTVIFILLVNYCQYYSESKDGKDQKVKINIQNFLELMLRIYSNIKLPNITTVSY